MNAANPILVSGVKTVLIIELISQHKSYLFELTQAIARDDGPAINELDKKVESTFEGILATKTQNSEESVAQAEFLLEQLSPASSRTALSQRICEKLIGQIYNK